MKYADVVVDVARGSLDKIFQYRIPLSLEGKLSEGMAVFVPFGKGNRKITGYIVGFSDEADYNPEAIKEILEPAAKEVSVEQQLMGLAVWLKKKYGCTLFQAMRTVMPVRKKVQVRREKTLVRTASRGQLEETLALARKKKQKGKIRLLEALLEDEEIPYQAVLHKLNISKSTLELLTSAGICCVKEQAPQPAPLAQGYGAVKLNPEQQAIVENFISAYDRGNLGCCLIHGVTGSGKTEVYMELIAHVLSQDKQAILLIPEISLTFQTVMRFYRRFGDGVAFIHSRLSQGERYEQFEKAREGRIRIMIGPRSALFTPFENLGLIVIDEEHEGTYRNETLPRYHSVDVAKERARMAGAGVVLGSATPSVDTYSRAEKGEYGLYRLTKRAKEGSAMAEVQVVDLREELRQGNRSIFSRALYGAICDRLEKKEQVMLFLNRRGYAGFVSCRSCGEAIKCPHCDVTLKAHKNGRLICHYCGFSRPIPKECPSCGSPYIAGFGTGTQKVEAMAAQMFPQAKILRMDQDTTSGKEGHEKILSAFQAGEADILIGTQMIVKGHDFPNVTLVGTLAADLSLYSSDFRSTERTFQLLTQAAGRAGRADKKGLVMIQTYMPGHYSIQAAAKQDYALFYEEEMRYRRLMGYPPYTELVSLTLSARKAEWARAGIQAFFEELKKFEGQGLVVMGPADLPVSKINDVYYKIIYFKSDNPRLISGAIGAARQYYEWTDWKKRVMIQFDFM